MTRSIAGLLVLACLFREAFVSEAAGQDSKTPIKTPAKTSSKTPAKTSSKTLHGYVNSLGDMCSSAGVTLSSQSIPATVENVRAGSSAYYSGLTDGDKIIAGSVVDDKLSLLIERNGKQYAVKLNTLYNPRSAETEKKGKPSNADTAKQEEKEALSELGKYDIVLVVDRSGSMNEPVDGAGTTKWKWCAENISEFTGKIKPYLTGTGNGAGIEVVTFGTNYTIQKSSSPDQVKELFSKQSPKGSTDLAGPLKALFDRHFLEGATRPMLIAVMTDGMPNRGAILNDVIIDATRRMRSPEEIRLVFMQIGNDFEGRAFLETLDNYLVHNGARFDIVDSVAFGTMGKGMVDPLIKTVRHDFHPVMKKGPEVLIPERPESNYKTSSPPPKKPSEP